MADPTTENQKIGKVFVFTPPLFETTPNALQKGQVKRKFSWKISQLEIDVSSSKSGPKRNKIPSTTNSCSCSNAESSDSREMSEINLDYDMEEMRDSVLAYLENTFSDSVHSNRQGVESQGETSVTHHDTINRLSDINTPDNSRKTAQYEYELSLEQSQKLLGESQGFIELSLGDPHLTSQKDFTQSDITSADSLNSPMTPEELPTAQVFPSSFTELSSCTQHLSKVNIFAVVLQVNSVKEILVKSGINAGRYVRVSSLLVGDSSREYFKITFWRKTAEWVTGLIAGDVVVVKKLKIEKWKDEFYGQSTFGTTVVKLQRASSTKIPPQWLTFVSKNEARFLVTWLHFRHPYLVAHQPLASHKEVEWQTLPQFKANTLVHYRAKIVKVLRYNSLKGSYTFGSKKVNKVIAIAIDTATSEEVPIYLWGSQADWQYDLKTKIGQMWDFKYLSVDCKDVHGDLILHTTPQSTKSPTQPNLISGEPIDSVQESTRFLCISDLLKANLTGKVSVSGFLTSITTDKASVDTNTVSSIDKSSDLATVEQFFKNLVYLGCRSCLRALKQDHNSIYTHCSHCLNNPSSNPFGVMYCYKQCRIRFSDSSASIFVTSCHKSMVHLIKGFDPQDVMEGTKSKELFNYFCSVFNAMHNSRPKVSLNCETKLDENGFVERQTFELIDVNM